ncbi:DNA-directed DNA polymerase alpha subunit pol12 [Dispira parvispora]|uniref:DNA polymerase alpha subunit B n=1 Tax=Dispira parvispora TaxID=1520584 RepID=A0A9W8AU97_9FUNG|nr:DNA-directed DNA polymerase alpha subunit pol12 [Dispira parvispora]
MLVQNNVTAPMATDNDLTSAFGTLLDCNPLALQELKTLCHALQLSAEDLYIKWESYAIQQERNILSTNNLYGPTNDSPIVQPDPEHLSKFRQYVQRELEKQALSQSLQSSTGTDRKGRNKIGKHRMYTSSPRSNLSAAAGAAKAHRPSGSVQNEMHDSTSLDSLIEKLAMPQTPTKRRRVHDPLGTGPTGSPRTPSGRIRGMDFENGREGTSLGPSGVQSPQANRYAERVNRGRCEETLNAHLGVPLPSEVANCAPAHIQLLQPEHEQPFLYMYERIASRAQELDHLIEEVAQLYQEGYQHSLDFGDPSQISQSPVVVVGRICSESEAKLNKQSVVLEASRSHGGGCRVRLGLDQVPTFSLFPGQIVAMEGVNTNGDMFTVTKFLPPPVLPPVKTTPKELSTLPNYQSQNTTATTVLVASGPFTLDDNLEFDTLRDFFDIVAKEQPDVVLLMGPFVDHNHPLVTIGAMDMELMELFHLYIGSHFRRTAQHSSRTKILLLPSPRDLIHPFFTFPQPPFMFDEDDQLPPNVILVPNPAHLQINDVTLAVNNVDVLLHLSGEEISRNANPALDRLGRLTQHLLQQRSLYPLFPPSVHDVNLQLQQLQRLRLQCAPDILITSSQLNHFVKKVDQVLCINPGLLTKKQSGGTFAKLCVFPIAVDSLNAAMANPDEPIPHGVCDRTRVDIFRV